jgi:hypothetical protein
MITVMPSMRQDAWKQIKIAAVERGATARKAPEAATVQASVVARLPLVAGQQKPKARLTLMAT